MMKKFCKYSDKDCYIYVVIIIFIATIAIIGIIFGMLFSQRQMQRVMVCDSEIYVNGVPYVFRDVNGKKQDVIIYENDVYVPINGLGKFFDYSVETEDISESSNSDVSNGRIYLQYEEASDVLNIDTTTLEGRRFTNENLYNYDYTIIINWASWCPDCIYMLKEINENYDFFEENNIQLIGAPIYNKAISSLEENQTILSKLIENQITMPFENIVLTKPLENQLQSNIQNIPSFVIIDNRCRIVSVEDYTEIVFSDILNKIDELPHCGDC